MLAASICHGIHYTVLPRTTMTSRMPRCLFGRPNPQDTIEMLQDALDMERRRFVNRWEICSDDKENHYQRRNSEKSDSLAGKKRGTPYSRQTSIHDYWRARKTGETNKKPLATSMDVSKQQNAESSKTIKTTATSTITTTTTLTKST